MRIRVKFDDSGLTITERITGPTLPLHASVIELTRRQAQSLAKAIIAKWGGLK